MWLDPRESWGECWLTGGQSWSLGLWLQGPGANRNVVDLLVGTVKSWGSCMSGPKCPRAGIGLLMVRLGFRGPSADSCMLVGRLSPGDNTGSLVVEPGPEVSGCRALVVLELVFGPLIGWDRVQGVLGLVPTCW